MKQVNDVSLHLQDKWELFGPVGPDLREIWSRLDRWGDQVGPSHFLMLVAMIADAEGRSDANPEALPFLSLDENPNTWMNFNASEPENRGIYTQSDSPKKSS
ncbi:hypothetical protein, partial [Sutterella wadsworthensis]